MGAERTGAFMARLCVVTRVRMDDDPVTREEFEQLRKRVAQLEEAYARATGRAPPLPPPVTYAPAPAPTPTPAAPRPPGAARVPTPTPPPAPAPTRAPRSAASLESLLGQRLAPRIGAVLVFLATLFFLGVAVQRGWIGPLAQLAIAAAAGLALIAFAEVLAQRRGYGQYPMVVEALGACVLYATAFVAYALPYYQRATGMSEVEGGVLMAIVAAATVGLAVRHDSRVVAGLGYALSFATAGLGWGVLPALTVPYVAILGASLALLVAWKRWEVHGLFGTLVTGAFMVGFAVDAQRAPPEPWLVVLAAAVPAAAFGWLSLRKAEPASAESHVGGFSVAGIVALVTLAWVVFASLAPILRDEVAVGLTLFAWCAVAATLSFAARTRGADGGAVVAYAIGAVALYLLAAPFAWSQAGDPDFATTATYAVGALALAGAARMFPRAERGLWHGGLALAAFGALRAVFVDGWMRLSLDSGFQGALGPWEAWATFVLLAPAIALLFLFAPQGAGALSRIVFLAGVAFLGAWGFALFRNAFLTTVHVALVGGALAASALRREGSGVARDALAAGILLVALAAAKAALLDAHAAQPPMAWWLALVETILVAGALLALHHAGSARRLGVEAVAVSAALVGGAAVVIGSYVFAYAEGPWVSILLGGMGVAFLSAGFVLAAQPMYRYVGFGALGFVILRVFAVDLRETDLVVRAAVFAVLGAILLGVGYAYARRGRGET